VENKPQELSKGRLMRAATYASVSVAGALIVVKFLAWMATDSVSLLSTLVDSILDAGASIVNLVAVHYALQPADSEHRFGHGKAEPLAGLIQSGFIFASALFLIAQTVERFIEPRTIDNSEMGIAVMGVSIVLTVALVGFQRYVIRRTQSVAVSADSLHYMTDILVNIGVIVALLLSAATGWLWVDPLIAGIIALYILWSVREIIKDAMNLLMDHEFPDEEREQIEQIVLSHPKALGMHDLRTRSSGAQRFIQLHLVMDGEKTLRSCHKVVEEVEANLGKAFPDAEILIHEDPHGIVEVVADFEEGEVRYQKSVLTD
jgi:ferrous-iron efflux pump FieF